VALEGADVGTYDTERSWSWVDAARGD
jgi:hypothetical protein